MRRALFFLLPAALAGCSTLEPLAPVSNARAPAPSVAASPGAVSAARRPTTELGRIKAALQVLSVPGGDEAEAQALVEPVARTGTDPEAKAMAGFLLALVQERRRLKESAAGANAKLRDERKNAETQKLRADALQERAAELQQKLDALAELEKSLSEKQVQNR